MCSFGKNIHFVISQNVSPLIIFMKIVIFIMYNNFNRYGLFSSNCRKRRTQTC